MSKSVFTILISAISGALLSCQISEAQDRNQKGDTQLEGIVSLEPSRKVHETSLLRTINDSYYCDSHLLEVETSLRREISDENWFFQVEMNAKLDRKPLDFNEYLGKINDYRYQTDFAVQYHCINSQITIIILLDQGTAVPFGTPIGRIYIDVDTGEFMEEPRKSAKG